MYGTAVIIEPRKLSETEYVILNYYSYLYNKFKIVFYCGKSHYEYYSNLLGSVVDVRSLECDNLKANEYNDFLKQRYFWDSLEGEWVLIFQSDSWLFDNPRLDIDYFIDKGYSYIGGNMEYDWVEFDILPKDKVPLIKSFNGGLSLRKRRDMLQVIESFPSERTLDYSQRQNLASAAEDVYFSLGCILMDKKVGDDVDSLYFCMHTVYVDRPFGLHNPSHDIKLKLKDILHTIHAKI
jgi:hypothetical protein